MSTLQWALAAMGVVVFIGIYWNTRRKSAQQAVWRRRNEREGRKEDQLDFWRDEEGFDEFGVGQVRERKAPTLGGDADDAVGAEADEERAAEAPREAAPSAAATAPDEAPADSAPGRLVVISVRERDEHLVSGAALHAAMQACGLQYGEHQIYHRHAPGGEIVFSVASMVKPGFLIPDDADILATPGISMFLKLPGPVAAAQALDDLLETAESIAEKIGGELLNSERQPMDAESIARLRQELGGS